MGLFFEAIVVSAITWLLGRSAFQSRRERRSAQAAAGLHDAGVQVDERAWTGIVAGLEGEFGPSARGEQGRNPGRRE